MATKLGLYTAAATEIGGEDIGSLSQEGELRRVLDSRYDAVVAECLEAGLWNFAIRDVQISSNPSVVTEFGFQYAFDKPDDWVNTAAISADPYQQIPLMRFRDRGNYWLADTDPIYVSFVSNDVDYGLNLSRWPEKFARFVALTLAERVGKRASQSDGMREALRKELKSAKQDAKSKDAMNEAQPQFKVAGSFVQSRYGGGWSGTGRGERYWG